MNLKPGKDALILLATHSSSPLFIKKLREFGYADKITVFQDERYPIFNGQIDNDCLIMSISPPDYNLICSYIEKQNEPLVCVISWYGIFPEKLINLFNGRAINVHSGDLPRYRGAGGGSWQVLNNETRVSTSVQQLFAEVDTGPILFSESEILPDLPYPSDVKATMRLTTERVIIKLARSIALGESFKLNYQNENQATYFPRLDSNKHAWIDFNLSIREVERFIRAFSDPYPGALFRYGEQTYRVKRTRIRDEQVSLHPFSNGLILNRDHESIHVALHNGIICFTSIHDLAGNKINVENFQVGRRLLSSTN